MCSVCEGWFDQTHSGHKYCGDKCRKKAWNSGCKSTSSQYERISGHWHLYCARLAALGKRKKDGLTRDVILRKLEKQNYKCALSGLELTCLLEKGKAFPRNASIDRIIPGGPYTEENIQMVCSCLNKWRSSISVEEFIEFCGHVYNHNKGGESA